MSAELTPQLVNELLRRGKTRAQIAEEFGVTRQAITYHLNKLREQGLELYKTPRELAVEKMPASWDGISPEFRKAQPYNVLRYHLEYIATGGRGMDAYQVERLRHWYDRLESRNLILEFDPTVPPSINVATGGWRYVQRKPKDNDLVLRINRYTRIPDADLDYFRFPPVRP